MDNTFAQDMMTNEAPIGYFVLNDDLVKKGVICQWIVFFQKGGWSVF